MHDPKSMEENKTNETIENVDLDLGDVPTGICKMIAEWHNVIIADQDKWSTKERSESLKDLTSEIISEIIGAIFKDCPVGIKEKVAEETSVSVPKTVADTPKAKVFDKLFIQK